MEEIFGTNIDEAQPSPEENVFELEADDDGQDGASAELEDPAASEEEPEGQSTPSENKQSLLLGKFKTEDDLLNSYDNLMAKLGQQPKDTFESVEEAMEAYKQAEKQLGKPKGNPVDPDVAQLQAQLQYQQQQIQQYAQYVQALQAGQTQKQAQQTAREQTGAKQNIDPQKFLDEFYENPNGAIEKLVQPRFQQLQQEYNQQLQPMQKYYAEKYIQDSWERQAEALQQQIPDFAEYTQDITGEFQRDPQLMQYAFQHENGMTMALREAYNRVKQASLATQGQAMQRQVQQTQNRIQKQAARIKTGGSKRIQKSYTPDEAEIAAVFGTPNKKIGIFG